MSCRALRTRIAGHAYWIWRSTTFIITQELGVSLELRATFAGQLSSAFTVHATTNGQTCSLMQATGFFYNLEWPGADR